MNLGNFVGGAVQGYQAAERTNLQRQEQATNTGFRERQMVMAEQDQASQQKDRARVDEERAKQEALRAELNAINEQFPDDGKPQAGANYLAAYSKAVAKHSTMTPEIRKALRDQTEQALKTPWGQSMNKVLAGDAEELPKLLATMQKDPTGAKLDYRPREGVVEIILGNGGVLKLRKYAAALGTAAYQKELEDGIAREQTEGVRLAQMKNLGANADQTIAETEIKKGEAPLRRDLLQGQAAAAYSNADESRAGAEQKRAGGGGGKGGKGVAAKDVVAAVKLVNPAKDDNGKPDTAALGPLMGMTTALLQSGKAKDANSAAAMASTEYSKIAAQAQREAREAIELAKKNPAAKQKLIDKFGSVDSNTLKQIAIANALSKAGIQSLSE